MEVRARPDSVARGRRREAGCARTGGDGERGPGLGLGDARWAPAEENTRLYVVCQERPRARRVSSALPFGRKRFRRSLWLAAGHLMLLLLDSLSEAPEPFSLLERFPN